MLAMTIAWDNKLLWTWGKAVEMLQATLYKISCATVKFRKEAPSTFILSVKHAPNKTSWDVDVNKALQMINKSNSELVKAVLARSSRVITSTNLDPIEWLVCLQGERKNAYQFCIQPPGAPAFIGNTLQKTATMYQLHQECTTDVQKQPQQQQQLSDSCTSCSISPCGAENLNRAATFIPISKI